MEGRKVTFCLLKSGCLAFRKISWQLTVIKAAETECLKATENAKLIVSKARHHDLIE